MSYHPISVHPLSTMQKRKLISGMPTTIKPPSSPSLSHKIHLSPQNYKKAAKAFSQGKGLRIEMDPYACQMHGEGLFGNIMSHVKKAAVSHLPQISQMAADQLTKAGIQPEMSQKIADFGASKLKGVLGGALKKKKVQKKKKVVTKKVGVKKGGKLNVGKEILKGLKSIARPALKKLSDVGISAVSDLSGEPELSGPLSRLSNKGIDALGRKYGFGMGGALIPSGY